MIEETESREGRLGEVEAILTENGQRDVISCAKLTSTGLTCEGENKMDSLRNGENGKMSSVAQMLSDTVFDIVTDKGRVVFYILISLCFFHSLLSTQPLFMYFFI